MHIKDNIWKFGIYSFIDHIRLVWMIFTLYVLWLGFSFTDIGIFEMIFALVIVLFELPTGALADIIGRKKAVIISCILNGVAYVVLGLMVLPYQYYVVALIAGIAFSFISGADVALLYDSMKKLKRVKEYKKVRGKINFFSKLAVIVGVLLGPFLFTINPRLGFLITGAVYLLAAIIISSMVEPYKFKKKLNIKSHWKQTVDGLKFTIKHKNIMWLIAFFFLSTIGVEFYFDFLSQPLLIANGFEITSFSLIFVFMISIQAIVAWYTHKIENKLKEKWSLLGILLGNVIVFSLFGITNSLTLLLAFVLFYTVLSFQEIVFEDYINGHIKSSNRATILSVKSLIYNLLTAGIYVLAGWIIDSFGIQTLSIYTAIFILIGTIILFSFKKGVVTNKSLV